MRAVRQHDDLVGGHLVDAGQQLEGARVERRPALDHVRAELLVEAAHARSGRDRDDAAAHDGDGRRASRSGGEPRRALLLLLVHVGDVEALDRSGAVEHRDRPLRVVGVDVDAQRRGDRRRPAPSRRCSSSSETHVLPGASPPPETTKFVQYR